MLLELFIREIDTELFKAALCKIFISNAIFKYKKKEGGRGVL